MLTIYRRHVKGCAHKDDGRKYRRCRCPIWVDGMLAGVEIRESLGLANWEKAQERVREWEASQEKALEDAPITVEAACAEFLLDAEARNLREPSLYKYKLLFDGAKQKPEKQTGQVRSPGLKEFAADYGVRFLRELDLQMVRKFREAWSDRNIAAAKKLERLRTFFRFAQESGWILANPAKKLKSPRIDLPPTLQFTRRSW